MDRHEIGMLLDGESVLEGSLGTLGVVNPATGVPILSLPSGGRQEALRAAELAASGFLQWNKVPPFDRGKILRRASELMREQTESAALDMTREQGKPLAQARGEWLAAADLLDWFAEEGRRAYGRIIPSRARDMGWEVHRRPVGPVAAFTPWNFPAWTPMQKLAPALAAGCSVVLKPAEETPVTAWRICRALLEAGLPPKALSLIWGDPAEISSVLVSAPEIRKISLTGSTQVGRLLARESGAHLKKVTMELGGHAPVIVAEDADLDRAVSLATDWKFRNAGQVCVAPTRFLVVARHYDAFVEGLAAATRKIVVGDGADPATMMGPLATDRQRRRISMLVEDACALGAQCVAGGSELDRDGWFYEPTVLAEMSPGMQAMNVEPFGPLALVARMPDLDAAIEEANRLPVGLASYAFTNDLSVRRRIMERIQAGMLAINHFGLAMPETPFGGVLDSGMGSEGGVEGMDAYLAPFLVSTRMD
ncbi:NAD-dependent succinate-semialdehyde dehydrogenase [Castellaniella defragrans]|uniref:NAD-dependent succinate-semialdehyde dehydrogenase n=1 Tax=Castellaniella defragrans TaxID=75697 RepID=UPI0023EFBF22|nr:NAD-dependent succinate-semialdehyde dehydrogenase [Castellaniella defragrans]